MGMTACSVMVLVLYSLVHDAVTGILTFVSKLRFVRVYVSPVGIHEYFQNRVRQESCLFGFTKGYFAT